MGGGEERRGEGEGGGREGEEGMRCKRRQLEGRSESEYKSCLF
jgi:hypothetical protein